MMTLLKVLYKLFRFKPTIAWTFCSFLLAVSVAYSEDAIVRPDLVVLALFGIVVVQAFLAHAVNDLADEKVDRYADIEGTGRFKVLVAGIASRIHLLLISLFSLFFAVFVGTYIYMSLGFDLLVLGLVFVGLAFPFLYSCKPFKLGWRPFSEFTVVSSVIFFMVFGFYYVATQSVSWLIISVAFVHVLFNVSWFMWSRFQDIDADRKHGKITTAVLSPFLAGTVSFICLFFILYSFVFVSAFIVSAIVSVVLVFVYLRDIGLLDSASSVDFAKARTHGIYATIVNAVLLSLWLVFL